MKYLALVFLLLFAGCSQPDNRMDGDGFALLYSVTSQQQNVDKLMWIKDPGPKVKAWIELIATFNQEVTKQVDAWHKAGIAPNLKFTGLPPAENLARERATKRTTGELLFSEDVSLRLNLIVAQLKALGYCSDLCYAIGQENTNPEVKEIVSNWDTRFKKLNADGMALLESKPVTEEKSAPESKPNSPAAPRK